MEGRGRYRVHTPRTQSTLWLKRSQYMLVLFQYGILSHACVCCLCKIFAACSNLCAFSHPHSRHRHHCGMCGHTLPLPLLLLLRLPSGLTEECLVVVTFYSSCLPLPAHHPLFSHQSSKICCLVCKCRRESACIYPYRCLANWSHLEYIYIWGGILCGGWGLGVFVFFSFILLYMLT